MKPPKVDLNTVKRLLIIKLSAFGDVIHALPVAAALKSSFPHLHITWAVEEQLAPLLEGNPTIDRLLVLPNVRGKDLLSIRYLVKLFGIIRGVRRQRYEVTLDLQGLFKSAVVTVSTGARVRLAYHWVRELAALVEYPVPASPSSIHVVDQYLDVARYVGAHTDNPEFPFSIPEEDDRLVADMLAEHGLQSGAVFAAINPASAAAAKQWGSARFAALIDALHRGLGIPSVLVTSDRAVAAEVASLATEPFLNLAGRTTLKQLAAVLRRSAVHVCVDTGSAHLAAALCRPVIEIVGPTDPQRTYPYGQRENTIKHSEQCGTGCLARHCEFARPRCLAATTVDEVLARVERIVTPT